MHMIAYISSAVHTGEKLDEDIADIVKVAKRENLARNISGVLFFVNGQFLQIIEGREDHLRQLLHNIEGDPRHARIEVLIDTPIDERGFGHWNMDQFRLDDTSVFERETLKALTEAFKTSLLPKADTLVFYYKTLLRQKAA